MANRTLFQAARDKAPAADTRNLGGGRAYKSNPRLALAQIAMTGTFNGTFYADPRDILDLAKKVAFECADDPTYIAQVAIAAREQGYMKDMPAFLVTLLGELDTRLFRRVFNRVIDNGKMLRNVIQMARSGQLGKPRNISAGAYRRAIQEWFSARSPLSIWKASIGNDPSMSDILKLARPRPDNDTKAALYAYLTGKKLENGRYVYERVGGSIDDKLTFSIVQMQHDYNNLPALVRQYEEYKETRMGEVPDVDWRFLDALDLSDAEWVKIAMNAHYMMTFRNLNTFARHGVFKDKAAVRAVAERLRSEEGWHKARVFPYQLMTAWKAANDQVPFEVREALQDAMEIATSNVPKLGYKIYICVDVSGSMRWGVTAGKTNQKNGYGGWVLDPHVPRVIDVASLFAASLMRENRNCEVFAFSNTLHPLNLNPRDSVMTNADILAKQPAGGTNCSLPIAHLNKCNAEGDAIIMVSDYESWIDTPTQPGRYSDGTKMHEEWIAFKKRNRNAKFICMDLTPRDNGQVKERSDILQVGGFSDQVFGTIAGFMDGTGSPDYWVSKIQEIDLDKPVSVEAV